MLGVRSHPNETRNPQLCARADDISLRTVAHLHRVGVLVGVVRRVHRVGRGLAAGRALGLGLGRTAREEDRHVQDKKRYTSENKERYTNENRRRRQTERPASTAKKSQGRPEQLNTREGGVVLRTVVVVVCARGSISHRH